MVIVNWNWNNLVGNSLPHHNGIVPSKILAEYQFPIQ